MPCLCTTNTLRLFIRSLAQVDVVASTSGQISRQRFQKAAVRSFYSFRTLQQRHESSSRSFSSTSRRAGVPKLTSNVQIQDKEPGKWPDGSAVGESYNTGRFVHDTEDSFAELSLESIDAIAAESKSTEKFRSVIEEEDAAARGSKEDQHVPDKPLRTTFRRTKTQNTSLAIHYSSPRTPLHESPTPDRASGLKPHLNSRSESSHTSQKEREDTSEKDVWTPPPREHWQLDKAALKEKFPDGWNPRKRLSPDALAGIRALHAQMPERYTTSVLAAHFEVSPEAIRRILKSKWSPDAEEETDRQRRWFNRGKRVYTVHAEKGQKPPKRWRELGIGDGKPEWLLRKKAHASRPVPALITTARRRERNLESESDSLADRIL